MDNQVTTAPKSRFDGHKVFAAIGIILTIAIIIIAAILYYFEQKTPKDTEEETVKVTTTSAKPATKSATAESE